MRSDRSYRSGVMTNGPQSVTLLVMSPDGAEGLVQVEVDAGLGDRAPDPDIERPRQPADRVLFDGPAVGSGPRRRPGRKSPRCACCAAAWAGLGAEDQDVVAILRRGGGGPPGHQDRRQEIGPCAMNEDHLGLRRRLRRSDTAPKTCIGHPFATGSGCGPSEGCRRHHDPKAGRSRTYRRERRISPDHLRVVPLKQIDEAKFSQAFALYCFCSPGRATVSGPG